MKNEIIAEIIADENKKFEKLLEQQKAIVEQFQTAIDKATTSSFELKTDRLEEIIQHWNEMFLKQKKQLQSINLDQLQKIQAENKKHRIFMYLFMAALIVILILNKIKL